jgi:hypothetical protein
LSAEAAPKRPEARRVLRAGIFIAGNIVEYDKLVLLLSFQDEYGMI